MAERVDTETNLVISLVFIVIDFGLPDRGSILRR